MVTTSRCSVISLTVFVLGTLTSTPDWSTGAVSMKITSSTRTTSTSGVMLMSASADCVRPLLAVKATDGLLNCGSQRRRRGGGDVLEGVQNFAGEVVHVRAEFADSRSELIVGDDGRDSDGDSGGCGDEGLGDAGSDGAQRCGARGGQAGESVG